MSLSVLQSRFFTKKCTDWIFNEFLKRDDLPKYLLYGRESVAGQDLGFSGISCSLKMKPIGCTEMSVGKYHYTYLLTPWSRFLLEKLTILQLDKKFPAFYETRSFITAFTSARHLPLS
jgi:hypothetical protein